MDRQIKQSGIVSLLLTLATGCTATFGPISPPGEGAPSTGGPSRSSQGAAAQRDIEPETPRRPLPPEQQPAQPAPPAPVAQPTTSASTTTPVSTTGTTASPTKIVKDLRVTPDAYVITAGEAKDLLATVSYTDGTFDGNVTWSSSDNRILDVNPTTGKIQGKAEGLATVVVASLIDPSRKANVTVTVRRGSVTEALARVEPKEALLKIGETKQLTASIQMTDGSFSPNVRWESSNQGVAMVSGGGLVTAVGKGKATISAIASGDSTRRAACEVSVEE